jgi:hypothetical protein
MILHPYRMDGKGKMVVLATQVHAAALKALNGEGLPQWLLEEPIPSVCFFTLGFPWIFPPGRKPGINFAYRTVKNNPIR